MTNCSGGSLKTKIKKRFSECCTPLLTVFGEVSEAVLNSGLESVKRGPVGTLT
jgi:hypothetical protein